MDNGNGAPPKLKYDCTRCPAYCCSYDEIDLNKRDINRMSRELGLQTQAFIARYTKIIKGKRVLRHQKDHIFKSVCVFLDRKTRRCTIYNARPGVCHEYPDRPRCGYYDFLSWERSHQDDPDFIPLSET